MCEIHNVWCGTLRQTQSFPQPDSVYRVPTANEFAPYGHGKPVQVPWKKKKTKNKHKPKLVVYSDISGDGDVPVDPSVGVDKNLAPHDEPVLARVRLRSHPAAAAGSATQVANDGVVMRGVEAGPLSTASTPLDISTQTSYSQVLSDVSLDRIEWYVRRSPKPWQTRQLLPGLFRLMPGHDLSMLTVALMSIIRGIRPSADVILEESAAQPSMVYMDRHVMVLEDRVVHLLRACGSEPVV